VYIAQQIFLLSFSLSLSLSLSLWFFTTGSSVGWFRRLQRVGVSAWIARTLTFLFIDISCMSFFLLVFVQNGFDGGVGFFYW